MAQLSGYWTTGGSTGHQQTSYTQAQMAIAGAIYSASSKYEGIAPGFKNELAGSVVSANTVRINTGGAVVDGQWYHNDSAVDVTIPSASGAGNTRIDRIVLRCSWSSFETAVYRIPGADGVSPSAPAITQTSGTTYDIMLYQALVDTAGNVTLTDERVFAMGEFDLADGQVTESKIATDAVTTAKIQDGAVTQDKLGVMKTIVYIQVLPASEALEVGDGQMYFTVPNDLDSADLVDADASVYTASSNGTPSIQLTVDGNDMLSTLITIDENETSSYTAATQPVVNPTYETVSVGQKIGIDVDVAGTGTLGLDIILVFEK